MIKCNKMAQNPEPPSFVSDSKSYVEYKADVEMWSRITSLKAELQAETIVYKLKNEIKEKIVTQIGDKLKNNADGIKELLSFLDGIYNKDEMADAWDRYVQFSSLSRRSDQCMIEFITEWKNISFKAKTVGCDYSDTILAFKLLQDANLEEIEIKLVLTGVDYTTGKAKKNLLDQVVESLKKFKGRSVMSGTGKGQNGGQQLDVKVEPTWLTTDAQHVLLAKGWKPPSKGPRRRSRSVSPVRSHTPLQPDKAQSNYKGRKNRLDGNYKPIKCHICKCKHTEKCNCPCVYHLQADCPDKKTTKEETNKGMTPKLSYFMKSLLGDEGDNVVLVIKESLSDLVLLTVDKFEAIIDCACPTTVSGKAWIHSFIMQLSETDKELVVHEESERIFKFGGGEKRKSLGVVTFPCFFGQRNIKIRSEIVNADFPLLLGNSLLKKANAILKLSEQVAIILDIEVKMRETLSGHFCLKIEGPKVNEPYVKLSELCTNNLNIEAEILNQLCLINELTLQDVEKLHHQFGHSSKVAELIKNSNKMNKEVSDYLDSVESNCKSCKVNKKQKPKPAVGLPRASKFNQIVTMDLKQYEELHYKFILYLVDMFSRFMVAVFVSNKQPSIIGAHILEKWVSVFGRMHTLHSDRGGEFLNSELADVADYLGVLSTQTAAYSPNQNGMNERNHAICDRMIDKMRTQDPQLSAKLALLWAVLAKNSLQNVSGFSPFQIVFGEAPSLPSVYAAGPPGLEEVTMSKAMADHINAMFLGRQAYIECESDRVLKAALKQRVYQRGDDIKQGDWIYFKNKPIKMGHSKWEGPVKVIGKDRKTLYVVRGGKFLSINSDHAQIAAFEGDFEGNSVRLDEKKCIEAQPAESLNTDGENNNVDHDNQILVENVDPIVEQDDTVGNADCVRSSGAGSVPVTDLKKNDVIRFKGIDDVWVEAQLISRAGKVGGKYDSWWNLKNLQTGHEQAEDLESKAEITRIDNGEDNREEVYVVEIPRYRHHESICKDAKEIELLKWDEYKVYEEVEDKGQTRLGTNWVLVEKVVQIPEVKARLTIRGDQEETEGVRKDSPTVRKGNIKIFAAAAAKEGWEICSSDVSSAFLQGSEICRDVFILPPKERRVPGILWKLLKPVYGLVDAPRGWYLALDGKLLKAGCENCTLDSAMYFHFSSDSSNNKVLSGMALTHVDDILHGGVQSFKNVMTEVKRVFKFGTEEETEFRYVGMHMKKIESGIIIDQDHYVKSFELPDMDVAQGLAMTDVLDLEGQKVFRSHVARLLHVGYQSRPDVCFDAKALSTKYGKATKGDLKSLFKRMQKLRDMPTKMYFPNLGPVEEWFIVAYGDAGIKSLPDKQSSVGGQVILLVNTNTNLACVLNWRSKKLVRKVVSSLAGEALAIVAAVGETVYNKAILKQMYGETIDKLPVIVFTDSKNLYESVHSSNLVDDAWLITDISIIKDALHDGTITSLQRVLSEDMLANCLTKFGASAEKLMDVLQSGKYVLPPGQDDV